ncbi:hypothetical protein JCM14202_125 [Agrilactobacillus composti DSM 18527 = JCM 14202]|nr:hypothetical protein JCM14202_125 [Agrilactobacillus composti DSM 18527 = JCM 14202]
MKIHYRPAEMQDLATIMTIEHSGFTDDEAATINSMHDRIERISDTFLEAVDEQGAILGILWVLVLTSAISLTPCLIKPFPISSVTSTRLS